MSALLSSSAYSPKMSLDEQGERAFHRYIQSGGNFVGVHASTCALYNSSVYNATIGDILTIKYQSSRHCQYPPLPKSLINGDLLRKSHYFTFDPRDDGAVVILTVDESSYNNESYTSNSGEPRPIAWYIDPPSTSQPLQEGAIKAGRSFYTASGHSNGSKLNISE
ncbi:hypothetical protein I204_01308 [Kwoniella mangroviensis CBS 8886]|nr:hypothetical protein I204_01308 [Kwoniella mangroviensis CBS 8886]